MIYYSKTIVRKNRRESEQCAAHTVEVSMQTRQTSAQDVVETCNQFPPPNQQRQGYSISIARPTNYSATVSSATSTADASNPEASCSNHTVSTYTGYQTTRGSDVLPPEPPPPEPPSQFPPHTVEQLRAFEEGALSLYCRS